MKSYLFLTLLWTILFCSIISGQASTPPDCSLQVLAIEAALDNPKAHYDLAVEFFKGEKVPQNFKAAAMLWEKAVAEGDVYAMSNLGYLKYFGKGVPTDRASAFKLWKKAAVAGVSESQLYLARVYEKGEIVKTDPVEAYAWASVALVSTEFDEPESLRVALAKDAVEVLARITSGLSSSQLALAEKRSLLYKRLYRQKKMRARLSSTQY